MAFAAPIAAGLAIAGTALQGISAIQQGSYQAAVAKNNATIAEQNAASTSEAAQINAQRSDHEYAAAIGEELATQGASGLDVLGRTQVMSRMRTGLTGQEQALDIRRKGQNDATGFLQDAANYRAAGKQAKLQGIMTGIGDFLQAGSQAFSAFGGGPTSLASSRANRGAKMPWSNSAKWSG